MKKVFLFLSITCIHISMAQQLDLNDPNWNFDSEGHKILMHEGQTSLMLTDGVALRSDIKLENGIIEFDMFYSDEMSFPGIIFHREDNQNYEEFYLRPWLSGNPDATQYSPLYNGFSGWQLYYGESYAKAVELPFEQWVHFKLAIKNKLMDIYIGNVDEPTYSVELKRAFTNGGLGFKNAFAPAYFANLKVVQTDDVVIKGTPVPEKPMTEGTVSSWEISPAFQESALENSYTLPTDYASQTYTTVPTEKTGVLNIAQYTKRQPGQNTVYLKLDVSSGEGQTVPFEFGFSDRIRVYLNGQLLYYASDVWQSRDYKFLGTIGLHDTLFLPLKKGENEIVLAVSESFGGWGAIARFPSMSKIKIQ
ncbi:hypothetical protein J0X14_11445 [Muricauda sp. CAU 1633]|uniref:hypothetical protein n=1 Tax=Allomuricauda sp. CAU 1633 TaxID=2816036 RepID=UPI001A8E6E7F|nr:hypothetical protein [Muricauda sp. CAU 1633]MBO0322912.1 hypothetical protein [Muricauda sp. CAU 1633]